MEAIKKKMQAMKLEKDNAVDRAETAEQQSRDAALRAEKAEEEVRSLQKKIQSIENELDQVQEQLPQANNKLEEKDKALQAAEAEVAAHEQAHPAARGGPGTLVKERLKTRQPEKLERRPRDGRVTRRERMRKALENRTNMEDDRITLLENQLGQARLIAEESDKKYEEMARRIALLEADLERAEERAGTGESKIVELEEELRVVGNNLKSLEVSEEKAQQREESYAGQIGSMTGKLKEAEARAEFAERSVQKLREGSGQTGRRTCLRSARRTTCSRKRWRQP
uniref:Putative tropomyosin n=1 Tax=Ixodes ricinus TaxID=34613 RepID=A0A090X7M0_IXORI